jgi:hypothetical protein
VPLSEEGSLAVSLYFKMSMKRLAARIIDQFSHEAIIEIYVLDEAGKPLELYSGMPSGLTYKFFQEVTAPTTTTINTAPLHHTQHFTTRY